MERDNETQLTDHQQAPAGIDEDGLHDEDGALREVFVNAVIDAIERKDSHGIGGLIDDLHEADIADLLSALKPDYRTELVTLAGERFDYTAFTSVDESIRVDTLERLPNDVIARGLRDIDSDDAVFILEDLDAEEQQSILARIPAIERIALKRSLDYPEDTAGRRMQSDFIAVPPFWSVGQTIDHMREQDDLPEEFYELFVVDPSYHLRGTVALNRLLRAKRTAKIRDIMSEPRHQIKAEEDQEEAARTFERYDLVSAAVVDDSGRLVGILTIDDVVDVIQVEAGEDLMRLGGVGDEDISGSVAETMKSRFSWLFVNLITAVLASIIIKMFDATIEQMVALAVLMPIVASMGGNAGTQTMTVAVRALAMRDIDTFNTARIVTRETLVGLLNGTAFAVIAGVLTWIWFANAQLGWILALAMIINMVVAGLAGILIPIILDRFSIDPAIASGVFLTTVTDVVGFFAFLGLAGWWFGYF